MSTQKKTRRFSIAYQSAGASPSSKQDISAFALNGLLSVMIASPRSGCGGKRTLSGQHCRSMATRSASEYSNRERRRLVESSPCFQMLFQLRGSVTW